MIGRKNKKEKEITNIVRSEAEKVKDHNQPACRPLARASFGHPATTTDLVVADTCGGDQLRRNSHCYG